MSECNWLCYPINRGGFRPLKSAPFNLNFCELNLERKSEVKWEKEGRNRLLKFSKDQARLEVKFSWLSLISIQVFKMIIVNLLSLLF